MLIFFFLFNSNYPQAKGAENPRRSSGGTFKEGWFIFRSIKQFEALHESLRDICSSDINKLFKKIPSLKKHLSGKHVDEDKVKKTTYLLDDYLKFVSKDESLSQSEALYTFLCPSPDFYRQKIEKSNVNNQNEDKFSISSIFRRFVFFFNFRFIIISKKQIDTCLTSTIFKGSFILLFKKHFKKARKINK